MANIQAFVERMRWWCDEGDLGYDQSNRWDIRVGGECDCSSLVIAVLRSCGFDTGGATYTGNMRANLTARGWVIAARYPTSTAGLQAGDILLNDSNHVAVYIGGGRVAQASIDERGEIAGGRSGDQIDYETNVRDFYVYGHGGWNVALRYTGAQTDAEGWDGGEDPYNPNGYGEGYVREVQALLQQRGYDIGPDGVDGYIGQNTFNAIKKFQSDHGGLEVDGIPGPQTLAALRGGSVTPRAAGITRDGYWGMDTTRALQAHFGTPVDGVVSSQEEEHHGRLGACTSGWEFVSDPEGSQVIAAMQRALGIEDDGIAGPAFINALEQHYYFEADGYLDDPSNTVATMQSALNEGKF